MKKTILILIFLSIKSMCTAQFRDSLEICDQFDKRVDDFTGEVLINSSLSDYHQMNPIVFWKKIKKGIESYYISLHIQDSYLRTGGTSAWILFTDGTKYHKQTKIDVSAGSDGYSYSAYFKLTLSELKIFKTKQVKKFKLDIFEKELKDYSCEDLMNYAKAIHFCK